ncbi:hypothetical protein CLAIMM_12895 [Cladophialophora immunda]|nr:hypothetical protein CLAIMM_12895 [Cladophialophora immunda]
MRKFNRRPSKGFLRTESGRVFKQLEQRTGTKERHTTFQRPLAYIPRISSGHPQPPSGGSTCWESPEISQEGSVEAMHAEEPDRRLECRDAQRVAIGENRHARGR